MNSYTATLTINLLINAESREDVEALLESMNYSFTSPPANTEIDTDILAKTQAQTPPQPPTVTTTKPAYYCGAPTKKGTPCKRRVKTPGSRCYQHKEVK